MPALKVVGDDDDADVGQFCPYGVPPQGSGSNDCHDWATVQWSIPLPSGMGEVVPATPSFIPSLVLPTPGLDIRRGYEESVSLINHIGPYNGGAAGKVPEADAYVLDLRASGSYEVTVEQPPLAQAAEPDQIEFSGQG